MAAGNSRVRWSPAPAGKLIMQNRPSHGWPWRPDPIISAWNTLP